MTHAVARLRDERLARCAKPFIARGSRAPRCPDCRVKLSHCLCGLCPTLSTQAGMCLIMGDIEPLKPSNTGWLIADLVRDTFAFGWARTQVDPALLALLADPQWAPVLVFPGEFAAPGRVVSEVPLQPGRKPLFVLLDGTWSEACKMFRKSPYLDQLPVLSLQSEHSSRYRLRRSRCEGHLCTAEVAALCLSLAGEPQAGETLAAYLDVFASHYMDARRAFAVDLDDAVHQRLRALTGGPTGDAAIAPAVIPDSAVDRFIFKMSL